MRGNHAPLRGHLTRRTSSLQLHPARGTGHRAAFTLIELLVVIAIIAILAAILFPVFAQAKAQAKKAAAVSNAKQLNLAQIMYMNDNDDVFVPYFSGYVPATNTYTSPQFYWPQLITPYIQKANQGSGNGGQLTDTDLSKLFFDPIETIKSNTGTAQAYGNVVSWGISDDVVDWYGPPGYTPTYFPRTGSQAVAPAGTLIFVETYDWIWQLGYPGSAYARTYFDNASSDYPGVPTVGALRTLDAHYSTSYNKTCYRKSICAQWYADPKGINNTGFIDGHVKGVPVGTEQLSGQMWSLGGNNQWP